MDLLLGLIALIVSNWPLVLIVLLAAHTAGVSSSIQRVAPRCLTGTH
jgi:hypothetical protein